MLNLSEKLEALEREAAEAQETVEQLKGNLAKQQSLTERSVCQFPTSSIFRAKSQM